MFSGMLTTTSQSFLFFSHTPTSLWRNGPLLLYENIFTSFFSSLLPGSSRPQFHPPPPPIHTSPSSSSPFAMAPPVVIPGNKKRKLAQTTISEQNIMALFLRRSSSHLLNRAAMIPRRCFCAPTASKEDAMKSLLEEKLMATDVTIQDISGMYKSGPCCQT